MKIPINKIQKIVVSKSDEVALVVEKIIDSDAKELVLNIPRFSRLSDSLANFHLIKRETKLLDKKIIVESVDDKVIELSGLAGLESLNPILSRSRRQFYDIVSSKRSREEAEEAHIKKKKLVESVPPVPGFVSSFRWPKIKLKKYILVFPLAVLFIAILVLVTTILPRAEIKIKTVKANWSYSDSVRAEKLAAIDPVNAIVPAQVFSQKEGLRLSFPATGKKNIEQKATGKITIYNAYSSDPQPLVVTTRFITPDGKIFRLPKSVIVPGAKIIEGKIIPLTLETSVVADKPGSEYNIGPVSYFSIPGFKGTPKYQAFYAESKETMEGGFIGETAFPTNEDLKKGKAEVVKKLEQSLKEKITAQIPPEFKILDGAINFVVGKQNVITEVAAPDRGEPRPIETGREDGGNFAISSEAAINAIAFKETDVLAMLSAKIAKEVGEGYEMKEFNLAYEKTRADFNSGRLSFPVKFTSILAKKIDVDSLRGSIRGKSEAALRTIIYDLPGLESAVISLWPFWVQSVPSGENKITITVD